MKVFVSNKRHEGQTLIETALMLFLILLILLGITEFSRAWYTKSSLKNAARSGARLAVVTPSLEDISATPCPGPGNLLINTICTSPGIKNDNRTGVTIDVEGKVTNPPSVVTMPGDTILVRLNYNDPQFFILGNAPWPWPKALNTTEEVRMRYE
jgi:hypothetical protein